MYLLLLLYQPWVIVQLFDNCKTIPSYLSNKFYIIKEADKININSENRILKFIEEPLPGVYGFLVCSDSKQLLKTIISRCQKIINYYSDVELSNPLDNSLVKEYYVAISNNPSINVNNLLLDEFTERIDYVDFFNQLKKVYELILNNQLNNSKKLNIKQICGRIALINEVIERLIANSNIRLTLNYFVLELRKLDE